MGKEMPKATGDSDDCCWWPAVFSGTGHRASTQSSNPQRSCQRWGFELLSDLMGFDYEAGATSTICPLVMRSVTLAFPSTY